MWVVWHRTPKALSEDAEMLSILGGDVGDRTRGVKIRPLARRAWLWRSVPRVERRPRARHRQPNGC